jgi:DNA repair photolyase
MRFSPARRHNARGRHKMRRRAAAVPAFLPGISSSPSQLRDVIRAAREAGACGVWANLLFLRPGTREHFLESLARDWPDELERYERLYRGRAYLGKEETKPVREQVAALAKEYGIRDRRRVRLEPEPPVIAEQLALSF